MTATSGSHSAPTEETSGVPGGNPGGGGEVGIGGGSAGEGDTGEGGDGGGDGGGEGDCGTQTNTTSELLHQLLT